MWCECSNCGHHRANHPWIGYGAYGSTSGYAGCRRCTLCEKPSGEHVFVTHQFTPCPCGEYRETA